MRFFPLLLVCSWLFVTTPASAQLSKTVPYQSGDSWTYMIYSNGKLAAHKVYSVGPISKDGTLLFMRRDVVPETPPPTPRVHGFSSTTTCLYDFVLEQAMDLAESCSIALEKGKQWRVLTEVDANTASKQYTVVGLEEITVPAGKFTAVRIDAKREQRPKVAVAGHGQPAGKYLDSNESYWFVPSVKAFVKFVLVGRDESGKVLFETVYEMTEFQHRQVATPVSPP